MARRIASMTIVIMCAALGLAALGFTNGTVYSDKGLLSMQSRAC